MLIKNEAHEVENLSVADFITKVSESNFIIRVKELRWLHEKAMDITDSVEFEIEGGFDYDKNDYSKPITLLASSGWRSITSRLGGSRITYMEDISFIEGQPNSFVSDNCIKTGIRLILENIIVTNETGERVGSNSLIKYLPSSFTELGNYGKDYIFDEQVEDSELYDEDEYDTTGYVRKRFVSTYDWDIEATVKELGAIQTGWGEDDCGPHQAFNIGLYQAYSGKFLCIRSLLSRIAGVASIHEAVIVNNEKEVREFFGNKSLANELYQKIGLK